VDGTRPEIPRDSQAVHDNHYQEPIGRTHRSHLALMYGKTTILSFSFASSSNTIEFAVFYLMVMSWPLNKERMPAGRLPGSSFGPESV
jgi:hypothetical protein